MVRDMDPHKEVTEPLTLDKPNSKSCDKGVKTVENHEVYIWAQEIHA